MTSAISIGECMVELRPAGSDEEQRVVIDEMLAAIAPEERAERCVLVEFDLVGGDQPEVLLVPRFALPEVVDVEDAVAEPLHVRRPVLQSNHRSLPRLIGCVVECARAAHLDRTARAAPATVADAAFGRAADLW